MFNVDEIATRTDRGRTIDLDRTRHVKCFEDPENRGNRVIKLVP